MDDLEDDLEMEEWMTLSDGQQQAILDREIAAYNRWFDRLSNPQQIAYCIRRALENCVRWRRLMRAFDHLDFMREHLREGQMRLLKLRAWRQTGVYPGSG